jgi:hypothetical protein
MSYATAFARALSKLEDRLPPETVTLTFYPGAVNLELNLIQVSGGNAPIPSIPGADQADAIFTARLISPRRRPGSITVGSRAAFAVNGAEGRVTVQAFIDSRQAVVKNAIGEDLLLFWAAHV